MRASPMAVSHLLTHPTLMGDGNHLAAAIAVRMLQGARGCAVFAEPRSSTHANTTPSCVTIPPPMGFALLRSNRRFISLHAGHPWSFTLLSRKHSFFGVDGEMSGEMILDSSRAWGSPGDMQGHGGAASQWLWQHPGKILRKKIQFLPGISHSGSLPKHTPTPEQTRPSFFHMKERGSARCSNNLSFSIPLLREEPLGMAGKERDLKIAADFLCSWRSFPEQRKTWNRANVPLPYSYPKERAWVQAA